LDLCRRAWGQSSYPTDCRRVDVYETREEQVLGRWSSLRRGASDALRVSCKRMSEIMEQATGSGDSWNPVSHVWTYSGSGIHSPVLAAMTRWPRPRTQRGSFRLRR